MTGKTRWGWRRTTWGLMACLLGGLTTQGAELATPQETADAGYFLSFRQKGQLIWTGRMQDGQGVWYDVRIVPGYVFPSQSGWRNIRRAGSDLHEYMETRKYSRAGDQIGDCFEWAYEDCFYDFALKGSTRAWSKYFKRARQRVHKRVFGWWMAYPWALMQSTVDNVVRIPLGLTGMVAGTAAGAVAVPAYHLVDSTVKATWHGPVCGVVLPVAGYAWNTVAAPPLSLVGQKPAPSRVDGFWVRIVEDPRMRGFVPGKTDIERAASWGMVLRDSLSAVESERSAYQQELEERRKQLLAEQHRLNEDRHRKDADFRRQEESCVRELLQERQADASAAADELLEHRQRWSEQALRECAGDIRRALQDTHGLSAEDAQRVYFYIQRHPPNGILLDKTDPLKESIDVIKSID